jgi:3-oxoacyl-[acyl-carrier-protein] synthase-1
VRNAYITFTDCITPLGINVEETFASILLHKSCISKNDRGTLSASFSLSQQVGFLGKSFSFENPAASMMLGVILKRFTNRYSVSLQDAKTLLVICSTKGDIEQLSTKHPTPLLDLSEKMKVLFNAVNPPVIISNACISSLHGIIYAKRLVASGIYNNVIVTGVDAVTEFIQTGFTSLMATSANPCRPFDAARNGITLGEAVSIALVEAEPKGIFPVKVAGGAVSNDANHITGPSRDGSGLYRAIVGCIKNSKVDLKNKNAFFSPHGTATIYNDEMEAKAFFAAGLSHLPAVAYKGYFGHTLGASGLLELVVGIETMKSGIMPVSLGYEEHGVSHPMNFRKLSDENGNQAQYHYYLKTGSGFGGCNAAVLIERFNKNSLLLI